MSLSTIECLLLMGIPPVTSLYEPNPIPAEDYLKQVVEIVLKTHRENPIVASEVLPVCEGEDEGQPHNDIVHLLSIRAA